MAMISDVGASSLCCEQLDIVDSGLLTDRTLARTGWKGFPPYFRKVRPDLVEAHFTWAKEARIYDEDLLDDYSIVTTHGVRFFVRNDLFKKLIEQHAGPVLPVDTVQACMALNGTSPNKDTQFSISKRTCLVLNGHK